MKPTRPRWADGLDGERGVVPGPAAAVEAEQAAAEDFEHDLQVVGLVRTVDDGERTRTQRRGDLAAVVAVRAGTLHDHCGRRLVEAAEQFEQARAAFLRGGAGGLLAHVQRQAEIDHRDVDRVAGDHLRRLPTRPGPERLDPDRLEQTRQAVHPRLILPPRVGEEEVEPTRGFRLRAGAGVSGMEARLDHRAAFGKSDAGTSGGCRAWERLGVGCAWQGAGKSRRKGARLAAGAAVGWR